MSANHRHVSIPNPNFRRVELSSNLAPQFVNCLGILFDAMNTIYDRTQTGISKSEHQCPTVRVGESADCLQRFGHHLSRHALEFETGTFFRLQNQGGLRF